MELHSEKTVTHPHWDRRLACSTGPGRHREHGTVPALRLGCRRSIHRAAQLLWDRDRRCRRRHTVPAHRANCSRCVTGASCPPTRPLGSGRPGVGGGPGSSSPGLGRCRLHCRGRRSSAAASGDGQLLGERRLPAQLRQRSAFGGALGCGLSPRLGVSAATAAAVAHDCVSPSPPHRRLMRSAVGTLLRIHTRIDLLMIPRILIKTPG